jgi:hypothetical protein
MKIVLILKTETATDRFKTVLIVQAGNIPLLKQFHIFSVVFPLCLKYQEFSSAVYVIKRLGQCLL